jgi:hypothetical protein
VPGRVAPLLHSSASTESHKTAAGELRNVLRLKAASTSTTVRQATQMPPPRGATPLPPPQELRVLLYVRACLLTLAALHCSGGICGGIGGICGGGGSGLHIGTSEESYTHSSGATIGGTR